MVVVVVRGSAPGRIRSPPDDRVIDVSVGSASASDVVNPIVRVREFSEPLVGCMIRIQWPESDGEGVGLRPLDHVPSEDVDLEAGGVRDDETELLDVVSVVVAHLSAACAPRCAPRCAPITSSYSVVVIIVCVSEVVSDEALFCVSVLDGERVCGEVEVVDELEPSYGGGRRVRPDQTHLREHRSEGRDLEAVQHRFVGVDSTHIIVHVQRTLPVWIRSTSSIVSNSIVSSSIVLSWFKEQRSVELDPSEALQVARQPVGPIDASLAEEVRDRRVDWLRACDHDRLDERGRRRLHSRRRRGRRTPPVRVVALAKVLPDQRRAACTDGRGHGGAGHRVCQAALERGGVPV
mmetsp:Transcript_2717/g.5022  ORF Transcript_2717/g.5022 Transcript_2717/m.5022 type:complete len:349 (+) Transcript_2717:220-1266(+)